LGTGVIPAQGKTWAIVIGFIRGWLQNSGTFNKFPEIPVGGVPESGGNKQEIQNHPTRISGKPGNLLKVHRILQP
jgi:hypothetical protein